MDHPYELLLRKSRTSLWSPWWGLVTAPLMFELGRWRPEGQAVHDAFLLIVCTGLCSAGLGRIARLYRAGLADEVLSAPLDVSALTNGLLTLLGARVAWCAAALFLPLAAGRALSEPDLYGVPWLVALLELFILELLVACLCTVPPLLGRRESWRSTLLAGSAIGTLIFSQGPNVARVVDELLGGDNTAASAGFLELLTATAAVLAVGAWILFQAVERLPRDPVSRNRPAVRPRRLLLETPLPALGVLRMQRKGILRSVGPELAAAAVAVGSGLFFDASGAQFVLAVLLFPVAGGRGLLTRTDAARTRTAEILDSVLPRGQARWGWILLAAAPGLLVGIPASALLASIGTTSPLWVAAAAAAVVLGGVLGTIRGEHPGVPAKVEDSLTFLGIPLMLLPFGADMGRHGEVLAWIVLLVAVFEVGFALGGFDWAQGDD